MKTALFVHDQIFYEHKGDFYSARYSVKSWNRFLDTNLIDRLLFIGKGKHLDEVPDSYFLLSDKRMIFAPLFEVNGGLDFLTKGGAISRWLDPHVRSADFVIIRTPSFIGYHAYKLCKKLHKPYLTEVVGCAWDALWNYGNIMGKVIAPFEYFHERKVVKNSFASLYVTEKFLQRRYPTNADLKENASNVEVPGPLKAVLNNHLDLLEGRDIPTVFKIGMLGNIGVKYKGYEVMLKALKRLKDKHPEIQFEFNMVGGGSPLYVENLIKHYGFSSKEVKVVGHLQRGEKGVFAYLDSLDLYIHPSLTEGLPRSLIEAMSRGCPVLASSVGGIPELIPQQFLHKPGDSRKLSEDLFSVLSDAQLRVEMSKENFERARDYAADILEGRRVKFYTEAFTRIMNFTAKQ